MVSAVLHDALRDPVSVITSLQQNGPASELPLRVARHFQAIFKDDDAFQQIPTLDATHPPESYNVNKSRPLIRFRAMVQDTSASPEMYLAVLRNGLPGAWGLAETVEEEGPLDFQHLAQREVVWAVSVPGESPFVAKCLDDAPASCVDMRTSVLRHKDPLMRERHIGAQVKIYDATATSLKPTDLRTFVGFLTFEHLLSVEGPESEPVPTLHALYSVEHPSTLLPFAYPVSNSVAVPASSDEFDMSASTIRDELIQWIADEALGGDLDAAEWVLLVSVARVQSRQPPLLPLSLTLSHFPRPTQSSPSTPALTHVLRQILPLFVDVPLSLSLLNTRPFAPESRDESLHSGLLQLPAGTTILLTDSNVQEGKINESGVKNIQALRSTLAAQRLDYQFPFSPYQFPTDLAFIFLTEGKKSAFVETHVTVPLVPRAYGNCFKEPEDIPLPSPAKLDAFRRLVGGAMTGQIEITEDVSQYIQADFVRERQETRAMTAEDLMTRMAVARLMALLHHDTVLTREVWQRAKALDERRKQHPQGFRGGDGVLKSAALNHNAELRR